MKNITLIRTLILYFFLIFITACGDEDKPIEPPIKPFKRTLLIYIGADSNGLDNEANQKLNKIAEGWNSSWSENNVLVYQDTRYNKSPRLVKITAKNKYEIIKEYTQHNSADPQIFNEVIKYTISNYDANSYGLLVFSHGTGWLPSKSVTNKRADLKTKSIIVDHSDEMDIKDFANAIPKQAQIDFIIFEACNMAGIEVAYELKDKTKFIAASSAPILSPGFTSIYANSIDELLKEETNLEGFCKNFMSYTKRQNAPFNSATMSIIKTAELDKLAQTIASINKRNLNKDIHIEALQAFDDKAQAPYYFYDMKQYYDLLANENEKQELNKIFKECIIYKDNTEEYSVWDYENSKTVRYPIKHHCGLTTYIFQNTNKTLDNEYKKLKWYNAIF